MEINKEINKERHGEKQREVGKQMEQDRGRKGVIQKEMEINKKRLKYIAKDTSKYGEMEKERQRKRSRDIERS